MHDMTDEQLIAEHDRAVRIVAEAVFGLSNRFPTLPPVSIFEGALKGAVTLMLSKQGNTLAEIADLLEECTDALRRDNEITENHSH